jgi:hypothetical protein
MNSKKQAVTKETHIYLHCDNCMRVRIDETILRDDGYIHCLECESKLMEYGMLSAYQKQYVQVPVISTTKLTVTQQLSDVLLALADLPAKDMRAHLRNIALALNTISGVTK